MTLQGFLASHIAVHIIWSNSTYLNHGHTLYEQVYNTPFHTKTKMQHDGAV